eukprot:1493893-Amphidinium_carterae.2
MRATRDGFVQIWCANFTDCPPDMRPTHVLARVHLYLLQSFEADWVGFSPGHIRCACGMLHALNVRPPCVPSIPTPVMSPNLTKGSSVGTHCKGSSLQGRFFCST